VGHCQLFCAWWCQWKSMALHYNPFRLMLVPNVTYSTPRPAEPRGWPKHHHAARHRPRPTGASTEYNRTYMALYG
jgi:hypothetical protein